MRRRAPLALFLLLIACADNPVAPKLDPGGLGELALLNALTAGDVASVHLDGALMGMPPTGQSGTALVAAGVHRLQAIGGSGEVLASVTFTMVGGAHRTAVMSGGPGRPVLLVTPLDTAAVPLVGAAKVRLVHTAPDAATVDAYLFGNGQAADSSTRFVSGFHYGSGTDPQFPGYAVRPPGEYLILLKAVSNGQPILQAGPITLNGGDVYSFVLAQDMNGQLELRTVKEH